jgi:hypothetical protein
MGGSFGVPWGLTWAVVVQLELVFWLSMTVKLTV